MNDLIITLTTDFGEDSPYVAAMKGVILHGNPRARIVDLSHQIPPQDLWHTAYFLANSILFFPPEVIHVVVVDPGVGSERALLCVELNDGQLLLVPDNGCWTQLASNPTMVRRLANPIYWHKPVSSTFHGRDILAPVAAALSTGLAKPKDLGPVVSEWVQLRIPQPILTTTLLSGQIVFVDRFGNLISNIPVHLIENAIQAWGVRPARLAIGDQVVTRLVETYAEAEPGTLVALFSSSGRLEFAVVEGNAAQRLNVRAGTAVTLTVEN